MKNQIKLTNEQINAKTFPKLTINGMIADFEWEINSCKEMVAKAKANQEKNPDSDYSWNINSWTKQMESAKDALKSLRLCYSHLSKEEKDIPLINPALSPNMVHRMSHSLKRAFRNRQD